MAGLTGSSGGGGSADYVQDSKPADPSDSETWIDTSDPARPLHVYSADKGRWVDVIDRVPLFVTQEAVSFGESGVTVRHNNTEVVSGAVQLLNGGTTTASPTYDSVNSLSGNWYGWEIDLPYDTDSIDVTISSNSASTDDVRLLDDSGNVLQTNTGIGPGGTTTFSGPFSPGKYHVEKYAPGDYAYYPNADGSSKLISTTDGSKNGGNSGGGGEISDVSATVPDATDESVIVEFDSIPTDIAAWDRFSWQYDDGQGSTTFDVETNDGSGWTTYDSGLLPPVSIADVAADTDVRLVANLSRPSGSDTSPAVPYVARRAER